MEIIHIEGFTKSLMKFKGKPPIDFDLTQYHHSLKKNYGVIVNNFIEY